MFIPSSLATYGRRLVVSFFIFALSSGVVGGVFFYLDWTGPEVFETGVQQVPVDMQLGLTWPFYQQNETTLENITGMVREQEDVAGTEIVSFLQTWEYSAEQYEYTSLTYLGIEPSFFDTFPNAILLNPGSPPLNNSTCYVQEEMMGHWGVDIGQNLTIHVFKYNQSGYEIELNVTLLVVGTFTSQLFMEQQYWSGPQLSTLRVVTTRDSLTLAFGNASAYEYGVPQEQVWIAFDRAAVIRGGAAVATDELTNIRRRIEQRALPYVSVPYDGFKLLDAVTEFSAWSSDMRAISVCASLPTIIMGAMLVHYESTLTADQRRRDTGTLRTRGASGMQAFMWTMTAALFMGLVGSIGAVIIGYFAASLSGTVRTLLEFQWSQFQLFAFVPQPSSVVFVFMFSFILGLFVALPGAVRAMIMSASEARAAVAREDLPTPEKAQTPWANIIGLGLSAYALSGILSSLSYISDAGIQASLLITALPFLVIFMFTFARLLSSPAATVKAKVLSWFRRPSLSAGATVVGRNLVLYHKTQSLGVMFVAMVFTAGVFSALSATTGYYHMRDLLMFQAGADIRVDVSSGEENITLSIMGNLTTIEGIESAAAMLSTNAYVRYTEWTDYYGYYTQNRSIRMFAVQPSEWYQAGFWQPYFALSGNPQASLQRLVESNSTVITSFKPILSRSYTPFGQTVTYGDTLTLTVVGTGWKNQSVCTIVDVLGDDPAGQGRAYFPGQPDLTDFLIINLRYVHACLRTTKIDSLYIRLRQDANFSQVIEKVHDVAPGSFKTIDSGLKRIDDALALRSGRSIFGVYTLNLAFSITYLTIGIAIVSIERIGKLRRQLSVFRALGGEPKSIAMSIMVETAVGLLIAAAIGSLLSLLLTYLIMKVPLMFFGSLTATLWSRLPIELVIPTELLLSIVGFTFLCSLCSTFIVTKRGLSVGIAEDIQVEE